jgi:hypothetical protein
MTSNKSSKSEGLDLTPVEFPELRELDIKVSKFLSPQRFIQNKCLHSEDFLLSEVVEFEAFPDPSLHHPSY